MLEFGDLAARHEQLPRTTACVHPQFIERVASTGMRRLVIPSPAPGHSRNARERLGRHMYMGTALGVAALPRPRVYRQFTAQYIEF